MTLKAPTHCHLILQLPDSIKPRAYALHHCSLGLIPGLGTEIPHQASPCHTHTKRKEKEKSPWLNVPVEEGGKRLGILVSLLSIPSNMAVP